MKMNYVTGHDILWTWYFYDVTTREDETMKKWAVVKMKLLDYRLQQNVL